MAFIRQFQLRLLILTLSGSGLLLIPGTGFSAAEASAPRPKKITLEAQIRQWLGPERAALFPLMSGVSAPTHWGKPLNQSPTHQAFLVVPSPQSKESPDTVLRFGADPQKITSVTASIRGVPGAHAQALRELLSASDLRAAEEERRRDQGGHAAGRTWVIPVASLRARLTFNSVGDLISMEWNAPNSSSSGKRRTR